MELVREGEKNCSVSVHLEDSINSELTVYYKDGKKSITVDGKKVEDRKELLSIAPCIVFCHEDMEFVAGTPERRRWFFDQTQSLWDPLYLEDLRNFRKVLKSRNIILKTSQGKQSAESISMLDALDPQLVKYGHELMRKRRAAAEVFSDVFEPVYREISGIDNVQIRYVPSWKQKNPEQVVTEEIFSELVKRRDRDFSLGLSFSGPHRDRYVFVRNDREFTCNASTGQRRLLALLLRVAQARIFSLKTGKKPVLLLDDVLLELDGEKRKKFLSLMPEYDQGFYTFLPEEPYEQYRKADTIVYNVHGGDLKWEQ
jgi:DNA replication and repair protein RecF